MILLPPSGMRDTRHNLDASSLHPRSTTSPLYVISHPCLWKKSSQSASARTAADRRLLMTGASCERRAAFGSLLRSSVSVAVVVRLLPFGWMTVLADCWIMAR